MHRARLAACATVAAATGALVLATAPTALAHVTIDPDEAEQGGYTVINVKVPNERDNASTISLELHLDLDHPLSSVMPQPVPGWDVEVETAHLDQPVEVHGSEVSEVPSVITWTGGEISPGQFQQFPLSIGPLPEDVDHLVFKAIQTYDNDEVVRWIEEPAEGGEEPENPAPVLQLAPAAEESEAASGAGASAPDSAAADGEDTGSGEAAEAADDEGGSDTTARVLGVAGIVVGAAGVAFGVLAGRRRSGAGAADGGAAS
ncbi:YcnI family protein [Streptomyces hoynatensis]|uniref:DUF1775 domain-containing protein n=1 Tax=Streptomyces hoynatensis TaxID=1141874 RepID=A0A3A9YRG6_9ACTN|nr:YcnI family protein [Streptomyces hoynatensis]RKN38064.1 DUF1775 domain-containing protein [Streptomyces hoynatensis]